MHTTRLLVLFTTAMTLLWSASAWPAGSLTVQILGWTLSVAAVGMAVTALVARPPRTTPAEQPPAAGPPRVAPATLVAVFVEVAAIVIAVSFLARVDPDLIQPAIATIVGAHWVVFWFFPATRSLVHVVAAVVGVAVGGAGIAAVLAGQPAPLVHGLVGIGMATLTLGYALLFLTGRRASSPPAPRA